MFVPLIGFRTTGPSWAKSNSLKEATVETLKKRTSDSEDSLKLLVAKDIEDLGLGVEPQPEHVNKPITTKSLAKDGSLDEILKNIEAAGSLEDSLLALGSTEPFGKTPTKSSSIPRLDNDDNDKVRNLC
ncbi:hypothetical protein OS493_029010 [Desmophyllum pertusum]|uniref:Uncharacterized protein n=1 Tax=Desmophyllum pertusum TaxID=174260 RepID=A0A9X0CPJ3_9CNID|nr:hypothetical protein OS493_029010 [Desmophyllum pertusum]